MDIQKKEARILDAQNKIRMAQFKLCLAKLSDGYAAEYAKLLEKFALDAQITLERCEKL